MEWQIIVALAVMVPVLLSPVVLVWYLLRRQGARSEEAVPALREVLQNTGATRGRTKMKPILVVDDEEVMRASLKDWLTDGGYEVETAEVGDEALKAIEVNGYEIAILDLRLPGKDGIQILKEAKAKRPQLKVIIMTAYPSVETAVKAMKEGAVDYLPKPLNMNELEEVIRNVLGPVQLQIKPKPRETVEEPAEKTKLGGS